MSLVVPCTGCPAKLSAPETAAGKQIRCPKCGTVVEVPGFVAVEEVPVVDAKVAPPRPKRAAVADDDDEEETEEERPRAKKRRREPENEPPPPRRKKRKGTKGKPGGGAAVLVIVGLILFVGLAVGAFFLVRKGANGDTAGTGTKPDSPLGGLFDSNDKASLRDALSPAEPPAPAPAGWQLYDYPDAGFKAYFPKQPIVGGGSGGTSSSTGAKAEWKNFDYFSGGYTGMEEGVTVKFWLYRFSTGMPYRLETQLNFIMPRRAPAQAHRVRWLGHEASEFDQPGSVVRVASFGETLVAAQVIGPRDRRPQAHELAGFFTNVTLTK